MINSAGQHKRQYEWLKDYQWKPGQSGNPTGGKPGKTLKVWAREFLSDLPDEKKMEFLKHMPPEVVWKMAEGNPDENKDITSGGLPLILPSELISKNDTNPDAKDSSIR